jgi:hypothetical protein
MLERHILVVGDAMRKRKRRCLDIEPMVGFRWWCLSSFRWNEAQQDKPEKRRGKKSLSQQTFQERSS